MPRFFLALAIFCSLLILSCKDSATTVNTSPEGAWESIGYGRVAIIENGEFELYDVTTKSCLLLLEGNIEIYGESLKVSGDSMSIKDGINNYHFTRIQDLPELCTTATDSVLAIDPVHNFEVLSETFSSHYAYFKLRNVDWNATYQKYHAKVNPETSPAELYIIMEDMLDEFNDGHVYIDAPDEVMIAADSLRQISAEISEETETESPQKVFNNYGVAEMIANHYLEEKQIRANGMVRWGRLKENVGYIQVNQMMGMVNYGIPDSLSFRDYWMTYFGMMNEDLEHSENERKGIVGIMDEAIADLENTKAIILDARFNGGGQDEVGLEIMSRFNNEERLVFTKQARVGEDYTAPNKVILHQGKSLYDKPLYLLTSYESASATEIMILSSLLLDKVTRIGSASEGVFSDVLDKALPNGFEFGLSNEVYLDTQGNNYEGIGIPPDLEMGYTRDKQTFFNTIVNALPSGGDPAVERAIDLINNSTQ